jgi:hypothetical protein
MWREKRRFWHKFQDITAPNKSTVHIINRQIGRVINEQKTTESKHSVL